MSGFDKWIPSVIQEYEVFEPNSADELQKVASVDLPEDFIYDPDYLYLWVRIVSAGEYYGPNKNGDYFPEQELLDYYHTFKQAHPFKNHENKKVENAIGQVIDVRWNPVMKCVEVFKGIDRKRAPEIVRGFLKGYLTDVSMGCKVPYTICSVCGNKAKKRSEFCPHVNKYRMQYLGNGERVFEINYEPSFHDSSVVLSGAERVAKALMIIDAPPASSDVIQFKKVASLSGATKYIKLTANELEKVANAREHRHPIFVTPTIEKMAGENKDLLYKLAEIEKEITGKILNVVSVPETEERDAASHMISVIKFLTEKRMDEDTICALGETLKTLAESEGMSVSRVFSVFLGIAELMGIELYPSELHLLLCSMTGAKWNKDLEMSSEPVRDELTPSLLSSGTKELKHILDQVPSFTDPSELHQLYEDAAHDSESFDQHPLSFLEGMDSQRDFDSEPPTKVVKIIRMKLSPMMSLRSHSPEHILQRILPFIDGIMPLIGNEGAMKDFDMMTSPRTIGDVLGTLGYKQYQSMRPVILRTKMMKVARMYDREMEKIASSSFAHIEEPEHAHLTKRASASVLPSYLKDTEAFPSGSFSSLNEDMLAKFASETNLSSAKVAALKTATLLHMGGLEKEASEILDSFGLEQHAIGVLLKHAMRYTESELEKMANDYATNFLIDSTFFPNSLSTTIPGRLADAFVWTKLSRWLNKRLGDTPVEGVEKIEGTIQVPKATPGSNMNREVQ